MDEKNTYPYLSVRWMSAVYQNVPVVLVPPGTKVALPVLKSNGTIQKGELLVPDPAPAANVDYETENEWTEARRAALLKWAILLAKSISLEVCAVFGNDDTVYVDPSGRKVISTQPPSGGIDAITGGYYKGPNLSHTGDKKAYNKVEGQQESCLGTPQIMPPKEPLELYIQKGDISYSILYLSIPDLGDDSKIDEMIDYDSYDEAEIWSARYYMYESPESFAFRFLEELGLDDVPGVALVEGDRPGSNLTFVEIKDSKALDELQKVLAEEGYEVTIKRF